MLATGPVGSAIRYNPGPQHSQFNQSLAKDMPSIEQFAEFSGNHVLLTTALLGSFMLLIFSEFQRKSRALSDVSAQTVIGLMNSDAVVIDTRSVEQFKKGHLVGARNFPGKDLAADDARLQSIKESPIVIVCDTGMQGARIAAALRKNGIEQAFSLKGGVAAWQQENLPLVAERKEKKDKKKSKRKNAKNA